ncbi:hypothetical protein GCM10017711_22040 [Paeniglutamicibacter sulfureus]
MAGSNVLFSGIGLGMVAPGLTMMMLLQVHHACRHMGGHGRGPLYPGYGIPRIKWARLEPLAWGRGLVKWNP